MEALLADWRFITFVLLLVGNAFVDKFILWRLWALSEERRKQEVRGQGAREQRITELATLHANFETAQEDIAGIGKKVSVTKDDLREDIRALHVKVEKIDRHLAERIDAKILEMSQRFDAFIAQLKK